MMNRKHLEIGLCLIAAGVAALSMLCRPATESTPTYDLLRNSRTSNPASRRTARTIPVTRRLTARRVPVLAVAPAATATGAATAPRTRAAAPASTPAPARVRTAETRLAGVVADLAGLGDVSAMLRFTLRLRADREIASGLRAVAAEWAGCDAADLRARGVLVAALLDRHAGVAQWQAAALGDRDAVVRATLLRHAPLTSVRSEDGAVIATLLATVESGRDAEMRRSALRGLTIRLTAAEQERLAQAAVRETEPETRLALVRELARHGAATPTVLGLLAQTAFSPAETELTRRVAQEGLGRLAAAQPGALDPELTAHLRAVVQAQAAAQTYAHESES